MGAPAARRAGRRRHRQRRQDEHEGSDRGRAGRDSASSTANERSFNNEQGLPVTILGAPDDVEVLVVEMGMRGFGEIARSVRCRGADDRGRDVGGGRPHRTGRRDRGRGPRQARVGRGAASVRHGDPQRRRSPCGGDGGTLAGAASSRTARSVTSASASSSSTSSRGRRSASTRRGVAPMCGSRSAAPTWRRTPPPRWPSPGSSRGRSSAAAEALGQRACRRCGWTSAVPRAGRSSSTTRTTPTPTRCGPRSCSRWQESAPAEGGDPRPDGRARRRRSRSSPGGGDRPRARRSR